MKRFATIKFFAFLIGLCMSLLSNAQSLSHNLISISKTENNPIRVVSYNLLFEKRTPAEENRKWSNRFPVVEKMFRDYSFDIIGTQEILTWQVDNLTQSGDYDRIGGDLGTGRRDHPGAENEAIFYKKSRFEVLESGNIWFSLTPDKPGSFGWDATYPRMCTWGKFKEKNTGKIFYVFNSHFHVESIHSRLESAKIVFAKIKEIAKDFPVICTGDFNATPDSDAVRYLLGGDMLKDSRDLASEVLGPLGTYHGFDTGKEPTHRIDYVLVNDKVKPLLYQVLDQELKTQKFGSDHLPVVVDVVFRQ